MIKTIFAFLVITCFYVNVNSVLSAPSQPGHSPAGGNYLTLDGEDDFATIDFKISNLLFKKETDEYTVEAWIYPTTPPGVNEHGTILRQQLEFYTVNYNNPNYQDLKGRIKWEKDELLVVVHA